MLSRRRFVNHGAASLACAMNAAWAQVAPPPDPNKVAAETDAAQHLTIEAKIDGKGPFHFVVDTGADRTVLATDVATSLGLVNNRKILVQGVVRNLAASSVPVRELSFGPVVREHLQLPILPRSMLEADGYLGLDTVDGYKVTLDFKNHTLDVAESVAAYSYDVARGEEERVPVYGRDGHLRSVDCRVDGVHTTAFVDTGAEVSVGNPELLAALQERDPKYTPLGTVPLTGVTGGVIDGGVIFVNKVKLHELEFSDCSLVVADLQIFDLWGLSKRPALLIGMNFLRQFSKVSIDYRRKDIRFDLAKLIVARRT